MASADFGILGGFRGGIGNVVGFRYRRRYLMRSIPLRRSKRKKLKALPQHLNLGRMSQFIRDAKELIAIGFKANNPKLDPRSMAMKYNMKNALVKTENGPLINYAKIKLSRGSRERAWSEEMIFTEGNKVTVNWDIPAMLDLKLIGYDKVYIVLYNEINQSMMYAKQHISRSDLTYTGTVSAEYIGKPIHGWIFFVSADGKEVSDSDYLGTGMVLA
jgi:hypothetical protein